MADVLVRLQPRKVYCCPGHYSGLCILSSVEKRVPVYAVRELAAGHMINGALSISFSKTATS